MGTQRRSKSPRHVAIIIGAFFLAYGAYARWFTRDAHPLYAIAAWLLGMVWIVLALLWKERDE